MRTRDETKATRDVAIVAAYKDGVPLAAITVMCHLGRQRVVQILKAAGVFTPQARLGARTKFLGVSITEETKARLVHKAQEQGLSVSKLTSDALDALVGEGE